MLTISQDYCSNERPVIKLGTPYYSQLVLLSFNMMTSWVDAKGLTVRSSVFETKNFRFFSF